MSDGLNEIRAIRITEIMSDYRNLHAWISQLRINACAEEYHLEGYVLLRQCVADAMRLLASPLNSPSTSPISELESQKAQLKALIVDAAVRRFQCQRLFQKAYAAYRWASTRNQILQGGQPHAGNVASLQATDAALQAELRGITDEFVYNTLLQQDTQIPQPKWVIEDPSLHTILMLVRTLG